MPEVSVKTVLIDVELRDYFAAAVLTGWAANGQIKVRMDSHGPFDATASWCYAMADAMLAARKGGRDAE